MRWGIAKVQITTTAIYGIWFLAVRDTGYIRKCNRCIE